MRIEHYITADGRDVVTEWLKKLRDARGKTAIVRRMDRMEKGNFGDHHFCRDGVWELRVDVGPGYRVYYGLEEDALVLLICGGDKETQSRDIERAVSLLKEYKERKKCQI